jgi:hypothetical protein
MTARLRGGSSQKPRLVQLPTVKKKDLIQMVVVPASQAALWLLPGMWQKVAINLMEL